MIDISCHCGNVNLTFKKLPAKVRDCDCPICNRLGALWGDFDPSDVSVSTKTSPTATYSWGDNDYQMHHCTVCGCTTHYADNIQTDKSQIGINLRMLDRRKLEQIPIAS